MTPAQFSQHMTKAAAAVPRFLAAAEAVTLQEAKALAITLSSGTLTTATLRRAGHPFAVRAPNSAYDPGLINSQSKVFRSSFLAVNPMAAFGEIVSSVLNNSAVAGYLANGTRFMIARPLAVKVQAAVRVRRLARTAEAIRSAFLNP